jgi:hypothetical protein
MVGWQIARVFDIHYCPAYPLDAIQASDKIRKEGMEKFRPALAENISKQGLVNPLIILNHRDPAHYKERWLKTGNNRLWALRHLGWKSAPAVVTGKCEFPSNRISFKEAQDLFKDGSLSYDVEIHGGILQMRNVCKPEDYEYPMVEIGEQNDCVN